MGSTEKTAKVLLLGTGESGKSTIMKQMKILYHGGFTEQEHVGYKAVIIRNILQSVLAIVAGMDKMEIKFSSPAATEARRRLQEVGSCLEEMNMSAELLYVLKELWKDYGFQAAIERSAEYQLNDSALYYLSDLDRVCGIDYIPNDVDILHACTRTTEIVEEQFIFKELNLRMFDAGGQRPERKKWISCFEDVTCIIFCTALNAYDLALVEDEEVNQMHESLHLFNSICNHKFFTDTSIVLFLNKKDLFQDKISKVPLRVCFPNYNGSNTYEEASDYIRQQFEDLSTNKGAKPIYTHLTCAVDTQDIESKMSAVIDIIMKNLKECGLL